MLPIRLSSIKSKNVKNIMIDGWRDCVSLTWSKLAFFYLDLLLVFIVIQCLVRSVRETCLTLLSYLAKNARTAKKNDCSSSCYLCYGKNSNYDPHTRMFKLELPLLVWSSFFLFFLLLLSEDCGGQCSLCALPLIQECKNIMSVVPKVSRGIWKPIVEKSFPLSAISYGSVCMLFCHNASIAYYLLC